MKTLKFKTNINCAGCIANVSEVLNKVVGEKQWEVDIKDREKTLTVQSDTLSADDVAAALKTVGYNATSKES
jgi:copper chaperone